MQSASVGWLGLRNNRAEIVGAALAVGKLDGRRLHQERKLQRLEVSMCVYNLV